MTFSTLCSYEGVIAVSLDAKSVLDRLEYDS